MNNSYGGLPVTGASITLGGMMFDQAWLLVIGMMLVTVGAVALRLTWRRGATVTEK